MIDEQVKQHDRYSVEIKVSFGARKKLKLNDFAFNIWMFIPNSLDVNRFNYSKSHFYRDLRTNIRLTTPVYLLRNIVWAENSPFIYLEKASRQIASQSSRTNLQEYEYQIKMFLSILKSSLRDEVTHINGVKPEDLDYLVVNFIKNVRVIFERYKDIYHIINVPHIDSKLMGSYLFGEEFMCNVIEKYSFILMKGIKNGHKQLYEKYKTPILSMVNEIIEFKKDRGYQVVDSEQKNISSDFVNRLGLLKKYAESHLYLNVKKRKDGVLTEQFLYSLAAGISMIFATIIAFSVQQQFGNYTMPLFVALVVSYMLKDRIKELARFYFAHKMGSKYFDHKIAMNINDTDIGWAKESMDFISDSKIPKEILQLRNRSSIIDATYKTDSEKVILYRMHMHIDREKLNSTSPYFFSGVNSIIRLNTSQYLRNMDNPDFTLYLPDELEGYQTTKGKKLYYLNLIIQKQNENQNELRHYRLVLNRDGIIRIEE
ncbi:MAG: hypothetical protein Q8R90_05515 [Bacteroidales bacterium]|nr:hypothetical protein [Bacteroidales bacterium]